MDGQESSLNANLSSNLMAFLVENVVSGLSLPSLWLFVIPVATLVLAKSYCGFYFFFIGMNYV